MHTPYGLSNNPIMRKKKQPVKVGDCMSKSPVTINSTDSLKSAVDLVLKYNIRELPVIDFGRLAGIVTDRDLRQVSPSYPVFRDQQEIRCYLQNLKVARAMTGDPLVVSPQTPLVEAA